MNLKKYNKKINLNIFVLIIIILLGFSILYFLFNRQRSTETVYISTLLVKPQNSVFNVPFNWMPYWINQSVQIGDKERNPYGGVNLEVIDKESVDSVQYGHIISLTLKINAIKDRSGIYLYKNKPLSVGAVIDMKLPKTQVSAFVTSMGTKLPKINKQVLQLTLKGTLLDSNLVNSIKIGDTVKNNKGKTVAKIISKNDMPANQIVDGIFDLNTIQAGRSAEIVLEIKAQKIDSSFYFFDNQKLRANEDIFISFPSITINNFKITKVQALDKKEIN